MTRNGPGRNHILLVELLPLRYQDQDVYPDSRFRLPLQGTTKVVMAGARADERKVAAKKDE
jgi:hypothetical protein